MEDRDSMAALASLEIWPMRIAYSGIEMGRQAARLIVERVETGVWPAETAFVPVEQSHGEADQADRTKKENER